MLKTIFLNTTNRDKSIQDHFRLKLQTVAQFTMSCGKFKEFTYEFHIKYYEFLSNFIFIYRQLYNIFQQPT